MAPAAVPMLSDTAVQGFNAIIGQELPIRILQGFLHKAAIPHALLFTGGEGIGKRTVARRFAMAVNCKAQPPPQRPCGQCRTCRQIADNNHPDIIEISPDKGVLRISQVRGLLSTLAMRPFNAEQRVVILSDAHTMNAEAGNALLKVLEEPPAGTILILTAAQRSDLLPTINSRCRHIRFNPLTANDLARLLVENQGISPGQAETVAQAADGSYTRALDLVQTQWHQHRDWLIRAAGLDRPEGLTGRCASLALAFSAQLAMHKERIDSDLAVMGSWIRDLSLWPYAPGQVIHRDRSETLNDARPGFSERQLIALWEAVAKAQKAIAANANLRLTLDLMALRMTAAMAA